MSKKKITKELAKEFIEKECKHCDAYIICGGELAGCKDWEKFLNDKEE